jgi:type II secretory pathway pseudopilin PulG
VKRDRGYSLVETVVVIAIFFIFLSIGSIKYRNLKETRSLLEGKIKIQDTFQRYVDLSFDSNTIYELEIDFKAYTIVIRDSIKREMIERVNLPSDINYATPYDGIKKDKFKTTTTKNGNLSDSFTIYLFDYKKKARYRVAFYIYQKNQILKINTYINISAEANYDEIVTYHESNSGQNHIGWEKE